MGWTPDKAVGQTMSLGVWFDGYREKQGEIVGVVRNFQYHSLHRAFEPLVFHILPNSYYYDFISVRIEPGAVAFVVPALAEAWRSFNPDRPFESSFLDAQFDALYRSENRLSRLIGLLALLAILIAGLGLFGLAESTTDRRTKEIGIRKVFGATAVRLFALLWVDLLRPVLLAMIVAVPLTFVLVGGWLARFAEHVEPSVGSIVITAMIVTAVSLVAVGYHTVRVAVTNPIDSLRYE
jgi:putative ABC transport system permease protein